MNSQGFKDYIGSIFQSDKKAKQEDQNRKYSQLDQAIGDKHNRCSYSAGGRCKVSFIAVTIPTVDGPVVLGHNHESMVNHGHTCGFGHIDAYFSHNGVGNCVRLKERPANSIFRSGIYSVPAGKISLDDLADRYDEYVKEQQASVVFDNMTKEPSGPNVFSKMLDMKDTIDAGHFDQDSREVEM